MLANFRRPTSSVFGLFTQPEVREVVYEVAGKKKQRNGSEKKTGDVFVVGFGLETAEKKHMKKEIGQTTVFLLWVKHQVIQ